MLRSIRYKFIIWYALVLALTFLIFSFTLYYFVKMNLDRKQDDILMSRADGIADSIDTYWEIEKMEALKHGARKNIFKKINNENFIKIAKRWVEESPEDIDLVDIVVQIYRPDGKVIAYSPNLSGVVGLSKNALENIRKDLILYEDRDVMMKDGDVRNFRILTIPVHEDKEIAYIVQVASRMLYINATLTKLKLILFILLPLTVILASILSGLFLASITLKPLKEMMLTVRQITAENMNLRLNVPEENDEIKELAQTFNAMLTKLNGVFDSQKQFIQDISHELRTPLTILRGELEVALKRERTNDEYISILTSNLFEIDKISSLLENLLTIARLDRSSTLLDLEYTDITVLVKDAVDDINVLAEAKNIKLTFLPCEVEPLLIDREKMRRAFLNLLDNAIKYTPENGLIIVVLKRNADSVEISVSDNGLGVNEEELPMIFDRFYQADKSRNTSGFGLGLTIVMSIITAHGGTISVKSSRGEGSVFTVKLPLHISFEKDNL